MTLSAVLVSTTPERQPEVAAAIDALGWAEVYHDDPFGRLIAVVDSPGTNEAAARLKALKAMPGVLAAEMILHAFEEEAEQDFQPSLDQAVDYLNDPDAPMPPNHFRRLKGVGNE